MFFLNLFFFNNFISDNKSTTHREGVPKKTQEKRKINQIIPTVKTRPETFLFQVLENTLGSLAIRPEAVPGAEAGHQDWVGAALDEGQN